MTNALTTATENTNLANAQPIISNDTLNAFFSFIDATETTRRTYTKNLKPFLKFLSERDISQPTRDDVIDYRDLLKEDGKKPSTIAAYLGIVKQFFSFTETTGQYPNIAARIKNKVSKNKGKSFFNSDQVREVLSLISRNSLEGKRNYAIMALLFTCGLRTIEVSRANIADMDDAGLYVQGKGHDEKDAYVKLPFQTRQAIDEYLSERGDVSDDRPLFVSTSNNSKGNRISTRTISGIAKRSFINAGFDNPKLTAHSTRHTAVTLALLAGKPIDQVRQFARHANIDTTLIYSHHLEAMKNDCSESVACGIF